MPRACREARRGNTGSRTNRFSSPPKHVCGGLSPRRETGMSRRPKSVPPGAKNNPKGAAARRHITKEVVLASQSQNLHHIQQTTRFTYASIYTCSHVAAAARPRGPRRPRRLDVAQVDVAHLLVLVVGLRKRDARRVGLLVLDEALLLAQVATRLTDRRPDRRAATAQRGPAQRGPPSEASKLAKTAAGAALIDGVVYLDTMLQRQIIWTGFLRKPDSTSFRWISSRNSGTAAVSRPVPGPETSGHSTS